MGIEQMVPFVSLGASIIVLRVRRRTLRKFSATLTGRSAPCDAVITQPEDQAHGSLPFPWFKMMIL